MRMRTHYSLHHAQAAAFHASRAASIELDDTEPTAIAMGAHVSAAVISAGAFLEATANEIAENDAYPRRRVRGQPSTLLKLNEHLQDNGVTPIAFADARWQATRTLMDLRHRLVHYTHDWLDWGTENAVGANALSRSDLLPRMQAQFEFLPPPSHYIPWFLSPSCAAWAIDTAVAFLDEFFLRLGTPPFHDHLRHRIEVRVSARVPCQARA